MKISAIDIRVGFIIEYEKQLMKVLKTMHVQPGKGGAYMQVEMKDIKNDTKVNARFRASETVSKAHLEEEDYQYLYSEPNDFIMMNQISYEQISIPKKIISENQAKFLSEGLMVKIQSYNSEPISILLPESMVMKVTECEAVIKGQTASGSFKPAIVNDAVKVMVPQFIKIGDMIVIATEECKYLERV